jgi:hypothetical protein
MMLTHHFDQDFDFKQHSTFGRGYLAEREALC